MSSRRRIDELRGRTFQHPNINKWRKPFEAEDIDLITIDKIGHQDYLLLVLLKKPDDEPGWFKEEFLQSLGLHILNRARDGVIFESGLVLNGRDILERPYNFKD